MNQWKRVYAICCSHSVSTCPWLALSGSELADAHTGCEGHLIRDQRTPLLNIKDFGNAEQPEQDNGSYDGSREERQSKDI